MRRISKGIATLLLAVATLSETPIMAQENVSNELKYPTLEDLIPGGETYRYAENLYSVQWWGNRCIKPGVDSLMTVNPKNGKETLIATRAKVNEVLSAQAGTDSKKITAACNTSTIPSSPGPTNLICSSRAQKVTLSTTSRKTRL